MTSWVETWSSADSSALPEVFTCWITGSPASSSARAPVPCLTRKEKSNTFSTVCVKLLGSTRKEKKSTGLPPSVMCESLSLSTVSLFCVDSTSSSSLLVTSSGCSSSTSSSPPRLARRPGRPLRATSGLVMGPHRNSTGGTVAHKPPTALPNCAQSKSPSSESPSSWAESSTQPFLRSSLMSLSTDTAWLANASAAACFVVAAVIARRFCTSNTDSRMKRTSAPN
mmetsp:Transcript_17424/g.40091  ORF Transcript_17424/g.40091 Transcript_17424/m.40091 type:complete len:225 (+) Transcript_17424:216-890(+)